MRWRAIATLVALAMATMRTQRARVMRWHAIAALVALAMVITACAGPRDAAATVAGGPRTAAFDHARTGWPLAGKHATTPCTACHTAHDAAGAVVYPGVAASCAGCHSGEPPHHTRGAQPCERCHTEAGWRPATPDGFDHRATVMPLVGAHRALACAACHPGQRYGLGAAASSACDQAGCHTSPHGDSLFAHRNCAMCHSPSLGSMAQISFDHEAWAPIGKHRVLACATCHLATGGAQPVDVSCERCHPASPHGERFAASGTRCATCHRLTTWKVVTFDHRTQARHAPGMHHEVGCRDCHRGSRPDEFEGLQAQSGCKSCHAHQMVHADASHPNGKYTGDQCINCHMNNPEPGPGARHLQIFHGIDGTFPLARGHKDVPCSACHTARTTKGRRDFAGLSVECGPACHADDLHRGSLGAKCSACHVPQTWEATRFDHDQPFPAGTRARVARFPLAGEHRAVICAACHATRDFVAAGTTCSSAGCHAADDAHQGQLGAACERCHSDAGDNRFDHATTRFPLDGKHREVACRGCHAAARVPVIGAAGTAPALAAVRQFTSAPTRCAGCHPVPPFHRTIRSDYAWYDADCAGCHTTRAW